MHFSSNAYFVLESHIKKCLPYFWRVKILILWVVFRGRNFFSVNNLTFYRESPAAKDAKYSFH